MRLRLRVAQRGHRVRHIFSALWCTGTSAMPHAGDPFGIGVNCQDYWLAVPPGWELALPNADSIAVAAAYTWGTHLLVYADGTQIYTGHSDYYSSRGQTREWICCSDGPTALGTSDIGFKANACARRVLLRACPAGESEVLPVSNPLCCSL